MTLIYSKDVDGPATHAFVVGCGYYPHLGSSGSADRAAPVAGALAIAELLLSRSDQLAAPLGSIEMLLSDSATADSTVDIGERLSGTLTSRIAPANDRHFRESGEEWLNRIRPGDVVVFYFSGHGITDRIGDAVGLLQDIRGHRNRPWAQSFSVTKLAMALRTLSAASVWVFFDACQEVVAEFGDRLWDVKNIELKEVTLRDVIQGSCEPLILAGAQTGQSAWAPNGSEPPYFTQVLLKGLSGCCVERTREHGWAVTGVSLIYDLKDIGRTIIDDVFVQPQSLAAYSERKVLLPVARPFTPVAVRSDPEMHLKLAAMVQIMHGSDAIRSSSASDFVWRVDVEFVERELTVRCQNGEGDLTLEPQTFRQQPPAHNITLLPARKSA